MLGVGPKAAPAATKMNGTTYGRELNHWKDTTKNFLRGVGLAQGSRKESETRECLVRYVKRIPRNKKKVFVEASKECRGANAGESLRCGLTRIPSGVGIRCHVRSGRGHTRTVE